RAESQGCCEVSATRRRLRKRRKTPEATSSLCVGRKRPLCTRSTRQPRWAAAPFKRRSRHGSTTRPALRSSSPTRPSLGRHASWLLVPVSISGIEQRSRSAWRRPSGAGNGGGQGGGG